MVGSGDPSPGGSHPSEAIIEAVAEHEGIETTAVEPPSFEPLYDVINPEALDDLFRGRRQNGRAGRVEFRYDDYWVTVYSDGAVEVEPAEDDASDADGDSPASDDGA